MKKPLFCRIGLHKLNKYAYVQVARRRSDRHGGKYHTNYAVCERRGKLCYRVKRKMEGMRMANVNCLRCHFRHEDNGNCTAVGGFCTAVQAAHCPLLRQYLDTGMTPEAFQSYVVFLQDLIGDQKASEALDRFRQLAKADRDGRVVVRPCKVGDTLFRVFAGEILEHKVRNMRYLAIQGRWDIDTTPFCSYVESSIGKTIFSTHEQAERALEAMKDGN